MEAHAGLSSTAGATFARIARTYFVLPFSTGSSAVIMFTRGHSADNSDPLSVYPDVGVPGSELKEEYLPPVEDEY